MSEQEYNEILIKIDKLISISDKLLKSTKADIEKIKRILAVLPAAKIEAVSLDRKKMASRQKGV
ncbi:MAG TPA: hypothetical protein GX745_00940 [Clostridiales bacterium]|nr:hypothetical protein [Clostridiales bacterium]